MKIKLAKIDTLPPKEMLKENYVKKTDEYIAKIGEIQKKLYAESKQALLIVLQGMDGSGKDGVIKNVFYKINPLGIEVHCFKKPTEEEFGHDFLWRVHKEVPLKGVIKIFNRSHYEDILIQRVHKWIDEETVAQRMNHINNFERLLEETGTKVLKFYLHVSKEVQLERLEERKINPEKMWKHKDQDMVERESWDEYMKAYEDCFANCDKSAEWQVIPADKNWYKEYLIAKSVCTTLEKMDPQFPLLTVDKK